MDEASFKDQAKKFTLARGAPFYQLQKQKGLLREDAFYAGRRSLVFVALAWGMPLLILLVMGQGFGYAGAQSYLVEPGVWARFVVAIGLFVLVERTVEARLRVLFRQMTRAPILAPSDFEGAAKAVLRALERRDAWMPELVCLILASLNNIGLYLRFSNEETTIWAVIADPAGNTITWAGWWSIVFSNTLFSFLLFRYLWRLGIWSMLLRDFSRLKWRLVSTHPDGCGGLSFLGTYPNAYTMFVLALSTVMAGVLAEELLNQTLSLTVYTCIMAAWLILVLVIFCLPLLAFRKPLIDLKLQALQEYSAHARQHYRQKESKLLGRNIMVEDAQEGGDEADPTLALAATQKLSTSLVHRGALLPISAAALLPLIAAGATQLPLKEVVSVAKKLLLF